MRPLEVAGTYLGVKEIPGAEHNPQIVGWIQNANASWIKDDETPWCSAFVYEVATRARLARPKTMLLRARSWLVVGERVSLEQAKPGDVVVFKRGPDPQPGVEAIDAPGHVGFYVGHGGGRIWVLGGNQSNEVNVSDYPAGDLLAVQRIA